MLVRTRQVRRHAALVNDTYVTGNGEGSSNPVNCIGANYLVLFVYVDNPASVTDFDFKVEFYSGSDNPYEDTVDDPGATTTLDVAEYNIGSGKIGSEERFTIVIPVRGRFARVSAKSAFSGTAPNCAIAAGTFNTVNQEGASFGLFPIREAAGIASTENETGDGPGSENAILIAGGNRNILQVAFEVVNGASLVVYQETSLDGQDFYRQMHLTGTGPVGMALKSYSLSYLQFGAATPSLATLNVEALGVFARYNFAAANGNVTSAACQALVGVA